MMVDFGYFEEVAYNLSMQLEKSKQEVDSLRHELYEMTVARDDYQRDLNGLIYDIRMWFEQEDSTLDGQYDKYFHLRKVLK